MSRRAPNPAADRQAQNQATLKSLLKLEPNKVCADCKRNKHPRWASWNLGVFVCIRCSGIHRGMGTHISRVKSVDLDSWTEEQMQSILSWGNARANKYWEAKLAAGHSPSESKIENFIRTKYEMKRWVMDGPKPDPSTLDADGDDDVPLSVVKEKQAIDRSESTRRSGQSQGSARRAPAPEADLIGASDPVPQRASTTGPPKISTPPVKAEPVAPKVTSTRDSLLGLDFLGGGGSAPPRPASTGASTPGIQSRPDLKQSILSLYATAPKPQPQPQQNAPSPGSFGGMSSPPLGHQAQQGSMGGGGGGGLNDAFGGLSMSNTTSPRPTAADPFASLGSGGSSKRSSQVPAPRNTGFDGLSGGSFFDSKPAQPNPPAQPANSGVGVGWGSFSSASPVAPAPPSQPAQTSSSAMGDLFDLSSPVTTTSPPPMQNPPPTMQQSNSVFNLSQPKPQSTQASITPQPASGMSRGLGGLSGMDAWGGNEWASAEPSTNTNATTVMSPGIASPGFPKTASNNSSNAAAAAANDFGWGSSNTGGSFASTPIVPGQSGGFNPAPKVSADEEFGGWSSSTLPATTPSAGGNGGGSKQAGGFGGDEDLFSNVWQ